MFILSPNTHISEFNLLCLSCSSPWMSQRTPDAQVTENTRRRSHREHPTQKSQRTPDAEVTENTRHRSHREHPTHKSQRTPDAEVTENTRRRSHREHPTQKSQRTPDTERYLNGTPTQQLGYPPHLYSGSARFESRNLAVFLSSSRQTPG
jgi:hypothetical protein